MKLNEHEQKCLDAMFGFRASGDYAYVAFKTIEHDTGLHRRYVRRAVRSLARKGLAMFSRGLMTEDGEVAGSGYAITDEGAKLASETARKEYQEL